MKKNLTSLFIFLFLFPLFCNEIALPEVSESVIENGLSVFVMEDFSSPLVRVEFVVKAGFSDQTAEDSGFFKLYAELFSDSLQYPLESAECLSDSTHYVVELSPSELPLFLTNLSSVACNPRFTDSQIKIALSTMKKQVLAMEDDAASFINQAIDSRIFSDSPWKHDSGIYPALFSKTTVAQARTYLNSISQGFYIPQNAAIFISGNVKSSEVLPLIEDSFGRYYGRDFLPQPKTGAAPNKQRKYVIVSDDFSPDYLQLVYQWTGLTPLEADMAAALYNNDNSSWKNALSYNIKLMPIGAEYINAASAWKNGSSRFVVQAILHEGTNPCSQSKLFMEISRETFGQISMEEYQSALGNLNSSFLKKTRSSKAFMETLAQYWVKKTVSVESAAQSSSVASFFARDYEDHLTVAPETFVEKLEKEDPYIFVLVNRQVYEKKAKAFKDDGFELVTKDNASWWKQNLDLAKEKTEEKPLSLEIETGTYWENFYDENVKALSQLELNNQIPVVVRKSKTPLSTIIFRLKGGELASVDDPGFEEVMVNLLCNAVTREIFKKQADYLIAGDFDIYAKTDLDHSYIYVQCENRDLAMVMKCFSDALIFSDIQPAQADRIVQSRQTKKRLQNGSAVNQMYCAGLNSLYDDAPDFSSALSHIFETENEILLGTTYDKILAAYPNLLDASRYGVFVEGDFSDDDVKLMLENTMGTLQNGSDLKRENDITNASLPAPSAKEKVTPIVHTFLTDIDARDAGPQPAILIPTKEFADPVLYFLLPSSPETAEKMYLIDAVAYYFGERLQKLINAENLGATVNTTSSSSLMKFALMSVTNVDHTAEIDAMMKELYETVCRELSSSRDYERVTQEIKNAYVRNKFSSAETHLTFMMDGSPFDYLDSYKSVMTADEVDFINVILHCFDFDQIFKVYSASSKQ